MAYLPFSVLVLLVLVVVGVLAWRLHPVRQGAPVAYGPAPLPVFIAGAAPVVAFVFYLASGYSWLAQLLGQGRADMLFLIFQIGAPLVGALVYGLWFLLRQRRLCYLLFAMGCLLSALMGLGTVALAGM